MELLKRILIFALSVLLFVIGCFTILLYMINSAEQNELLSEIAKNIKLEDLISGLEQIENDTSSEDADLWSIIKEFKDKDTSGNLDDVESTDDFMDELSKTQSLKNYFKIIGASLISGFKSGNFNANTILSALKESVINAVSELTGTGPESGEEWKNFANAVAEEYFSRIYSKLIDSVSLVSIINELDIESEALDTYKFLTSEKTRRVSVAICATVFVLMYFFCKGTGTLFLSAGIPIALAGALFFISGLVDSFVMAMIDKTSFYFLSAAVPILKPSAIKFGLIVFVAGILMLIVYNMFFKKRTNR